MTYKVIEQKFDLKLFQSALNLETTQPKQALSYYDRLDKANKTFFLDLFLLSIACPLLAFGLAFWITGLIPDYKTVAAVVIMAVLGYGVPLAVFQNRIIQIQGEILRRQNPKFRNEKGSISDRLKNIAGGIIWYFWGDYLKLANILMWFIVFLLPVIGYFYFVHGVPLEAQPDVVPMLYIWIPLILACAHTFSGRDIVPFFPIARFLAESIAGVRLNLGDILDFLASIWISGVLVAWALGYAPGNFNEGLLTNGIAGLLLGLSISKLERDRLLENIIILGRIRCLLRLRRAAENYHWLRSTYDYPFHIWYDEVGWLRSALELLHAVQVGDRSVDTQEVASRLDKAAKINKLPANYHDIWLAGVRQSRSLLK